MFFGIREALLGMEITFMFKNSYSFFIWRIWTDNQHFCFPFQFLKVRMAALMDPAANSQLSSQNKSIHISQDADVHLHLTISQSWSPLSFLLLAQCCCLPGLFLYYLAYLFKSWWMKKYTACSNIQKKGEKKVLLGFPQGLLFSH